MIGATHLPEKGVPDALQRRQRFARQCWTQIGEQTLVGDHLCKIDGLVPVATGKLLVERLNVLNDLLHRAEAEACPATLVPHEIEGHGAHGRGAGALLRQEQLTQRFAIEVAAVARGQRLKQRTAQRWPAFDGVPSGDAVDGGLDGFTTRVFAVGLARQVVAGGQVGLGEQPFRHGCLGVRARALGRGSLKHEVYVVAPRDGRQVTAQGAHVHAARSGQVDQRLGHRRILRRGFGAMREAPTELGEAFALVLALERLPVEQHRVLCDVHDAAGADHPPEARDRQIGTAPEGQTLLRK
jgi:hypothetical protein